MGIWFAMTLTRPISCDLSLNSEFSALWQDAILIIKLRILIVCYLARVYSVHIAASCQHVLPSVM